VTRTSRDIGRGLAPAREARPIENGERVHVVGAAGAGASAAGLLAHHGGAIVTGCDSGGPSVYTPPLLAAGIELDWQHSDAHVRRTPGSRPDRLAVTKALTAVEPDHPELAAARDLGIPLEAWQQLIADAAATSGQALVCVAGTHGKSTTAGWLVDLLAGAGRDPSAFVGALLPATLSGGVPATARRGTGDHFVVEADEYAGNFDPYSPAVAVLLNAEWDHPDVFADENAVLDAFEGWLRRAATAAHEPPLLVANITDAGVARIVDRLAGWPGRFVTVSLDGPADVRAHLEPLAEGRSRLLVDRSDGSSAAFDIRLAGRHNAENALAVVGAATALGVGDEELRRSLAGFEGVGRRLEMKGDVGGVVVLDDYGHHPTAIARTLEAVRQRFAGRRVWAVYEPLTYHRTALMLDWFADALAAADAVAVADIWAGRDTDTTIVSSAALAAEVSRRGRPAESTGSVEATADHLAARVQAGDVVLVMGGGRSHVIASRLVGLLERRQSLVRREPLSRRAGSSD
jgi:UDP-N-acetylmuramate--alanine ligase